MDRRTLTNSITTLVLVATSIAVGGSLLRDDLSFTKKDDNDLVASVSHAEYVVPPMVNDYSNERFRFSLKLPQGFSATELPFDGVGNAIVLQDQANNGIQIYVTEGVGDANELTADMVRKDIPEMEISEVQPVEIGQGHRGIAFMSDNEAYGGASREVWFYFGGNLYQISTYARLDALLQAMFGTWKFN